MESMAVLTSIPTQTPVVLDSFWNLIMSADESVQVGLYERLTEKFGKATDADAYIQRICTAEEYRNLLANGILDAPYPPYGVQAEEEIEAEIIEAENKGYLQEDESNMWFKNLAS